MTTVECNWKVHDLCHTVSPCVFYFYKIQLSFFLDGSYLTALMTIDGVNNGIGMWKNLLDSFLRELGLLLRISVFDETIAVAVGKETTNYLYTKVYITATTELLPLEIVYSIGQLLGFSSNQHRLIGTLIGIEVDNPWFSSGITVKISSEGTELASSKYPSFLSTQIFAGFDLMCMVNSNSHLSQLLNRNNQTQLKITEFNASPHTFYYHQTHIFDHVRSWEKSISSRNRIDFHVRLKLDVVGNLKDVVIIEPLSHDYYIFLQTFGYVVVDMKDELFLTDMKLLDHLVIERGLVTSLRNFQLLESECLPRQRVCPSRISFDFSHITEPGHFVVLLDYKAKKNFPTISNIPLDAGVGFVLQPSTVWLRGAFNLSETFMMLRPIPDPSMPYNVMTLVSTVMAFVVGSFINAWSRRLRS